jgi:uncharacterized membrane protein YhaH (DUF805 family)
MKFSEAVQSVFSKYNKLEGRSPRSEYWYWMLFVFIAQLVTSIPIIMIAMIVTDIYALMPFLIAAGAIGAFLFLLTITVSVRRLHDQGLSGFYFFLFLIPFIGSLIALVFMLQPSQPSSNKYGVQYVGK